MVTAIKQLIHPSFPDEEQVIATLYSDRIDFHSSKLQRIIKHGIAIPFFMQTKFKGKKCIYPKEDLFVQAFIEAYFPFILKSQGYLLKDMSFEKKFR